MVRTQYARPPSGNRAFKIRKSRLSFSLPPHISSVNSCTSSKTCILLASRAFKYSSLCLVCPSTVVPSAASYSASSSSVKIDLIHGRWVRIAVLFSVVSISSVVSPKIFPTNACVPISSAWLARIVADPDEYISFPPADKSPRPVSLKNMPCSCQKFSKFWSHQPVALFFLEIKSTFLINRCILPSAKSRCDSLLFTGSAKNDFKRGLPSSHFLFCLNRRKANSS